jgi:NitT/TauT family transport system substrate-binding protein
MIRLYFITVSISGFHPFPQTFTKNTAIFLLNILLPVSFISCDNPSDSTAAKEKTENAIETGKVKPAQHVRLLPYWVPSSQFAGYYVGIEKGIFQKHGIKLELLIFDPHQQVESVIRDKKTDFAILWLVNAMELREKGIDIVNIAQLSSRSSLMLITKKSSGISKLSDMNGKKAGIWIGYEKQPQALFKKYNLKVKMIPIGSTNNLFLQGGVDILNANWFDEYHAVINNGFNEDELNKFFFADYGLNFLEDGIYCLDDKVKENPELCAEFVAAVIESWTYAFNNQEEAIDIVEKYAKQQNQPVNRSHQRWMLSHYKELYIPPGSDSINTNLQQKDYDKIQQLMLESKLINKPIPYLSFFKLYTGLSCNLKHHRKYNEYAKEAQDKIAK